MDEPEDPLEELVVRCLDLLETGAERGELIEQLAAEHPELKGALARRLDRLEELGLLGESPAEAPRAADAEPEIAGYQLKRRLGAGGMGTVWLALQQEPVKRPVAIKVVRSEMSSARLLARFEFERQALARMQHPGIAQVYDAGSTVDGQPFFAMEFVDGRPLDQVCIADGLPLDERVRLVLEAAEAVQHAHDRGVLHRDLKPSNVLVNEIDGVLRPKVIDFGLAKATDLEAGIEDPNRTVVGQVLGTPHYMAPEQANPGEHDLDVRVDVYALGVMLYEVLTGSLPIELTGASIQQLQSEIGQGMSELPSARVRRSQTSIERKDSRPTQIDFRRLRGDLDWICSRALAVEPSRRYASTAALAADLRAYLEQRPVAAGPDSTLYRLSKFARRRKGVFLASALVAITALAGGATALHYQVRARRSLDWFDLLAERDRVGEVSRRAATLDRVVGPGSEPVGVWLADSGSLLDQRQEIESVLEELRGRAVNPSATTAPERGYEQGRYEVLDTSLTELLAELRDLQTARDEFARLHAFGESLSAPMSDEEGRLWDQASRSIADPEQCPLYQGLRIEPQFGLIPLRRNPRTALWEFVVRWPGLGTPEVVDDRVVIADDTAPVVVLIPGGSFLMGSALDPGDPNYDPDAAGLEGPQRKVSLDPYFIGKHELTQAQWKALTRSNPSLFTPDYNERTGRSLQDIITLEHPVERVSWVEGRRRLRQLGLDLPTEARWERAARGGRDSAWWTGTEPESLRDPIAGNLADQRAARSNQFSAHEPFDDGYLFHAPVDRYAENPFGLYGTIGNVWEWVLDANHDYDSVDPRPGDGLRDAAGADSRLIRGGGFDVVADKARHAMRLTKEATVSSPGIGLRLSRSVRVGDD